MPATHWEVLGTIRPDGTLELDEKPRVPPGRVKVHVETLEPTVQAAEGLVAFVDRIRREMTAAGSSFMNDAEVTAWIDELRSEDDRIEEAYRQAAADQARPA